MNLSGNVPLAFGSFTSSSDEDILIKMLLLTHDPDGRRLNSELLLCLVEDIMCCSDSSQGPKPRIDVMGNNYRSNIEIIGSRETLGQIIYKVQSEMVCKCSTEGDLRVRTINLFNLLEYYSWDAKVVLTLAAFALSYGEFWLIMQLYPLKPLAASVAILRQLPCDLRTLKPRFRALDLLFKCMVEMTKCIIKFEGLPFRYVKLDRDVMAITKSNIYIAAYWVMRSTLACSSIITDMIALKPGQVYLNSTILAAWELSSLLYRLTGIYNRLTQQVDLCHQQIEISMQEKLINLFQDAHSDNQEVLSIVLALQDDLPLKNSSQAKDEIYRFLCHRMYLKLPLTFSKIQLGVSELKDKVVLLLVSKPELLPLEGILLLVHQTYDHPHHKKLDGTYEIVWLPISTSGTWTDAEVKSFNFLSNSLPWFSVRQPWSVSSVILNYIKQAWNYKGEPLMVVLDSQGMITNANAIDMVFIWGATAYPFSSTIEKQLWERQKWTLQLLTDEIDPLLNSWVEEGKKICIYGSHKLEWITELNAKLNQIRSQGLQLEIVNVGEFSDTIKGGMHYSPLSFINRHFFWLRLESMRRSILRQEQAINSDSILKEVSELLDNRGEGWLILGEGSSTAEIFTLHGREAIECLGRFNEWGENVAKFGLVGAIRAALEPWPDSPPRPSAKPCNHSIIVPYAEGLIEASMKCEKCQRPMKMFVVYE